MIVMPSFISDKVYNENCKRMKMSVIIDSAQLSLYYIRRIILNWFRTTMKQILGTAY